MRSSSPVHPARSPTDGGHMNSLNSEPKVSAFVDSRLPPLYYTVVHLALCAEGIASARVGLL